MMFFTVFCKSRLERRFSHIMNMMTNAAPARSYAPVTTPFSGSPRSEHLLHREEYDFFLLLSSHHAQKRPAIELSRDLCELARTHAERELARHEPEAILLYLWNSGLRDEQFPGLVKSQTLLPKSEDSAEAAMHAILGGTADGRHLLAWNKFFQSQSHIGIGYASTRRGEASCYVFLSAEPAVAV